VAKKDLPYRERLREYAKIARQRMEADRFAEFCHTHLPHLNEVTWEFFGTAQAKGYVLAKVQALFPEHEVERFTEHFWGLIQFWRKTEADRMNRLGGKAAEAGAGAEAKTEAAAAGEAGGTVETAAAEADAGAKA